MSITVQNVIDQGFAKSAAARPDSLTAPQVAIDRVGQALREIFRIISRENPYVFGASALVGFAGSGWARPADCYRVIKVFATASTIAAPAIPAGKEIGVVPFNDQGFLRGAPSLTELGQVFMPTGQVVDPSAGVLRMVYARAPIMPASVDAIIDALFPDFFIEFLNYDMAAFLAVQDERAADVQSFLAMKNAELAGILEWCRSQTLSTQERFPQVVVPRTNVDGGRQGE